MRRITSNILLLFFYLLFFSGTEPSGEHLVRPSTKELLYKGGSVRNQSIVNKDTTVSEYQIFLLLKKNGNTCTETEIRVHPKKVKFFTDSMKAAGFAKPAVFNDRKKFYSVDLQLISQTETKTAGEYKFRYLIRVQNSKMKMTKEETIFQSKGDKILKAFSMKEYTVIELAEEKETGIIRLTISSKPLFEIFPFFSSSERTFYL